MFLKMGQSSLSSYYMADIEWLMDYTWSLLLGVLVFVFCLMVFLLFNKSYFFWSKEVFTWGEFFCGVLPIILLLFQLLPSYFFLYGYSSSMFDDIGLVVKVCGHQWFWSYSYGGYGDWLSFDSYMLSLKDLSLGDLRLLEVDERLVVPAGVNLMFTFHSSDVIHSWALPTAGIKVDVMPGIFTFQNYNFGSVGVYYGMCSEFCGIGHSFMPIVVEVVPQEVFSGWVEDRKHMFDIVTRLGDWYALNGVSSFV